MTDTSWHETAIDMMIYFSDMAAEFIQTFEDDWFKLMGGITRSCLAPEEWIGREDYQ